MFDFINKIPVEVMYVTIAAIGGIARYLQNYLNDGKFAVRRFMASIVVSSFSGYMFYQFALHLLNIPDNMVGVFAGIGGWMGVEAMKVIDSLIVEKFFNKKSDTK